MMSYTPAPKLRRRGVFFSSSALKKKGGIIKRVKRAIFRFKGPLLGDLDVKDSFIGNAKKKQESSLF